MKIWSMMQHTVSDSNLSFNCYHDKPIKDSLPISEMGEMKKNFLESRDEVWFPRNKRPAKLREQLKMLESMFQSNQVVTFFWKDLQHLKIVFDNGLLTDLELSSSNDISRIRFNKQMINKFPSSTLTSVLFSDHYTCVAFLNSNQIAFFVGKNDTKPFMRDIPGPVTKEIVRKLCISPNNDLIYCWWKFQLQTQNVPQKEQINIVLINGKNNRFDVLSSILTEEDLIDLKISKVDPNTFLTLERSLENGKSQTLNSVVYDVTDLRIKRIKVTKLTLTSGVLSFARNKCEDKLVIGCSDGKVVVYDTNHGHILSSSTRSSLVPNHVVWCNDCVLVASGRGELNLFDVCLNQISFCDFHDNQYPQIQLSQFLANENGLSEILRTDCKPNQILLYFNSGPLITFHLFGSLQNVDLIRRYLEQNKIKEAIEILKLIDWNRRDLEAFQMLMSIADEIFKQPLSHETEDYLEQTFSTFYSSAYPIDDHIVLKHRLHLECYLRRFFHHLLHHMRFEKAFLLAKDISSSDLFMDIHFAAKDIGEIKLAKISWQKANELRKKEADVSDDDTGLDVFSKINLHLDPSDKTDHLYEALSNPNKNAKPTSSLVVFDLGYV